MEKKLIGRSVVVSNPFWNCLGQVGKFKRVKLKLHCSGEVVKKVQVEKIILKWIIQKAASVAAVSTFNINPLNAELNPICHLLTLLGAHHFLHVSRIRVKEGFHTTKNNFFVDFCVFYTQSTRNASCLSLFHHLQLRFFPFFPLCFFLN